MTVDGFRPGRYDPGLTVPWSLPMSRRLPAGRRRVTWRSRARAEHFATQLALNPTAIRFDYHVLYTGAVITDREYRVIYHQPLPVSVVQACYEHFSTVDGVALFATTLDNDYNLCDRVGSSTNILPEFTPAG